MTLIDCFNVNLSVSFDTGKFVRKIVVVCFHYLLYFGRKKHGNKIIPDNFLTNTLRDIIR